MRTRAEDRPLKTRSLPTVELTRSAADEWLIEGIAVTWNTPIFADGFTEQFAHGAFDLDQVVDVPVYGEHNGVRGEYPIGKIIAAENRSEGLWVQIQISQTTDGATVYTLAKDKVLKGLSVGFVEVTWSQEFTGDNSIFTWITAILGELSIVARPAYTGAQITRVRSNQTRPQARKAEMTPEEVAAAIAAATEELRTRSAEQARQLTALLDGQPGPRTGPGNGPAYPFLSMGHLLKALATRSASEADIKAVQDAYVGAMRTRAYGGATTTDLGAAQRPGWIDRDLKFIGSKRRLFEAFSSAPLPEAGNTVEYPVVAGTTDGTGQQVNEGDDLGYVEVQVGSGSATVKTGGSYAQLTKQAIQRASISYLNKVLEFQRLMYGKWCNGQARATLTGYAGTNTDTVLFADKGKAGAWLDIVLQSAADFENNSIVGEPEFWVMGLTHISQCASVADSTNRPVFAINGDGVNTAGSVDLRKIKLNVGGLPVLYDPGLTGNYSYVCSSEAITTMEGGPYNLSDQNVINLSEAFSTYGYLALTKNDAKGITKVDHPVA